MDRARAGRWAIASDYAERAREIRLQYGVDQNQSYIPIAWIAAYRGDLDEAEREAEHALKLCEEQIGFHPPLLQAVPGIVALWRGDAAAAVEHLADADNQARALGWRAADARPWTPELVEALLQLDRRDEAVSVLERWERDAARVGNDYVLAPATRCRGLVAAARGAVAEAVTLLEEAVARHEALGDPFGRARAQLALGATLRRARQRRAAREAIEAALDGFEALGAATWVERSREELGRISGRTRRGRPHSCRAARRCARRRRANEPRGGNRALPGGPDGRRPSHADLRQARRALAHGARRQSPDVLTFTAPGPPGLASSRCRATWSRRISRAPAFKSGLRANDGHVRRQTS